MKDRYYDFDLLRGILMMWGVFVHTETLKISEYLPLVSYISGFVRMELFMMVSGFFSMLLYERYGSDNFIKRRFLNIAVPFFIVLITMNQITNWLVYNYHNEPVTLMAYYIGESLPEGSKGPMVWHLHLWFLIPLMFYIPIMDISVKMSRVIKDLSINKKLIYPSVFLSIPLACFASRVVYEIAIEPFFPKFILYPLRETLFMFPFYFLGILMYSYKEIKNSMTFIRPFYLVFSISFYALVMLIQDQLNKLLFESLMLIAKVFIAIVLSSFLLFIFERWFSKKSPISLMLSNSAYTVYLFHYVVIYMLAGFIVNEQSSEITAIAIVLLTITLTMCIHFLLINKNKVLCGLYNGKF